MYSPLPEMHGAEQTNDERGTGEDEEFATDTMEYEERLLDEIQVTAPRGFVLPRYNPAPKRVFDLIHTELELRFDWTNCCPGMP